MRYHEVSKCYEIEIRSQTAVWWFRDEFWWSDLINVATVWAASHHIHGRCSSSGAGLPMFKPWLLRKTFQWVSHVGFGMLNNNWALQVWCRKKTPIPMCSILSSVGILSTNVDNDVWNHGSYTRVLAAWFSKTPVWIGSGSDVVRSAEVFQLSVFARLQHQLRYIQQCFDWTKFWMFWASGMPWGFVVRWVLFLIIFRGTCTWHPLTPTCSLIQLSNLAARVQKKTGPCLTGKQSSNYIWAVFKAPLGWWFNETRIWINRDVKYYRKKMKNTYSDMLISLLNYPILMNIICIYIYTLVGGLEHVLCFHSVGKNNPNWLSL